MPEVQSKTRSRMSDEERQGQIIWFTDLREELDKGNYKAVREAITGAISMLEREEKNASAGHNSRRLLDR